MLDNIIQIIVIIAIIYFLYRRSIKKNAMYNGPDNRHDSLIPKFYSPGKIVTAEIQEDKEAYISTSRTSHAAGAVVGGVLLGNLGAVVGGLTGKKNMKETVTSIDLKLIVEDVSNPVIIFNFFIGKTKRGSSIYTQAMDEAQHWHGKFAAVIHSTGKSTNPQKGHRQ